MPRLSVPLKVILGLATAWTVVMPFVLMFGWFFMFFGFALLAPSRSASASGFATLFGVVFFLGFLVFLVSIPVSLGVTVAYIIHIVKNRAGSDVLKIVLALGFYFFPFLALPIYYCIYIWPDQPPAWALEPGYQPRQLLG